MTEIIGFMKENWLDIAMVIVGSFALLIYVLQNRKKEIDSASLVILQIDELQDRVQEISGYIVDGQLNETAFYESLPLMETNYWDKSKHYFVGKMDAKSFNTINCFYEYISAIQEQQLLMKNLQKNFFFLTQNVLATNEANFIVSAMNNSSTINVHQVGSALINSMPAEISDENKKVLNAFIQQMAESNQNFDVNLFWSFFHQYQNKFVTAINGKALTSYTPVQIKISLEKILKKYTMLEVSGSSGYNMLKKISKRKF